MNIPSYGLIPAAGKGTRARPYTASIPKGMLEVNGESNLQRNIKIMRDQLEITDIVIVVGYYGEIIKDYFGDGQQLGVNLHYIENRHLERGLAWSIYLGHRVIDDYFCVILSDECYVGSNHDAVKQSDFRNAFVTCFLKEVDDEDLIKKNYAVEIKNDQIQSLIEKPVHVENDILGCGTFICSPEIFPTLQKAFVASENGYVEFLTFLNDCCKEEWRFSPFWLTGSYININDRDSLAMANYYERSQTIATATKALLIYSEGCEENILFTIERYRKQNDIDSIFILVPHDNTIEDKINFPDVEVLLCPPDIYLYGEKLRYGIGLISSDIVILTEADYAFPARDINKLIAYLSEADLVMGTRTTRQLMEVGVDLTGPVRLANIIIAKFMELLWWNYECRFSDVGCTFRAFWLDSYRKTAHSMSSKGAEFSVEMIIAFLEQRLRVIEIPVNYRNVSRALNARYRNSITFFRFVKLVIKKRFMR